LTRLDGEVLQSALLVLEVGPDVADVVGGQDVRSTWASAVKEVASEVSEAGRNAAI
jgi:hypothetical protein